MKNKINEVLNEKLDTIRRNVLNRGQNKKEKILRVQHRLKEIAD